MDGRCRGRTTSPHRVLMGRSGASHGAEDQTTRDGRWPAPAGFVLAVVAQEDIEALVRPLRDSSAELERSRQDIGRTMTLSSYLC